MGRDAYSTDLEDMMVFSKLTVLDSTSQTSKLSLNKRVYIEYSERLLPSESGHSARAAELLFSVKSDHQIYKTFVNSQNHILT